MYVQIAGNYSVVIARKGVNTSYVTAIATDRSYLTRPRWLFAALVLPTPYEVLRITTHYSETAALVLQAVQGKEGVWFKVVV